MWMNECQKTCQGYLKMFASVDQDSGTHFDAISFPVGHNLKILIVLQRIPFINAFLKVTKI